MNNCVGCGAISEKKYCQRCFSLKYYGQLLSEEVKKDKALDIINEIDKKEHVLLVVDILDIPNDFSFFERFENITLVLTKRDLLPFDISDQKFIDYFEKKFFSRVIVVSSKKNYNMDRLYGVIKKYQRNYFVGFANSGKSTLINKLLYNYFYQAGELTTSVMPATTRAMVKIIVNDKRQLIDTPGIIDETNIVNQLSIEEAKELTPQNTIRPVVYQVKEDQTIVINDQFFFFVKKPNVIVFYFKNVHYRRVYKLLNLEKKIEIDGEKEIVVPGLGFVKIKKPGELFYKVPDYTKVFVREPLI